ncbi:MAG: hypothetical protein V7K40_28425 [Nostoc sp.]
MSNSYSICLSKIDKSAAFRLPTEFYQEHLQFANVAGWTEVSKLAQ